MYIVSCILWPQKTSSSLAKYQVCKSLIIDSGKNYYNCISQFMSVQLNNGTMNHYLLTVSKGSSFLICDAVLIGVQLLTFQRIVLPSSSASSSQRRIIYSFFYLPSLEAKGCQTATIMSSQTYMDKASHAPATDSHILILLCCKKTVPYLLTHLLQVSTVELVHTHDDMMTPARNITRRCSCSMERLGRKSIRQWFWSIVPLLNTWQLNNTEKLLMTEHIFISFIRTRKNYKG